MSSMFDASFETIRTWPRALRWAFWAAMFTIGFLVWDSTIADIGATWSAQADAHEQQIHEM